MIEFKNVTKIYPGNNVAMDKVNLKIEKGEFICLVGTSGSGKTTTMRMINRMNVPTEGTIEVDGRDISKLNEVDLRRQIGYVIQQIGLLPHMTIYENLVMVPQLLNWSQDRMDKIAIDLIEKAELPREYLDYYPRELSGGQQQRIGVMRALAADQEIILMDEPFGALDPITRETLQKLIKTLQKEMGKTIVFVTHDMDEALLLADRIVVMDKGKVVQFDSPKNILTHPETDFVEDMLGEERIQEAKFNYEPVTTIMITNPYTVSENATVRDSIKLMNANRVDTLFVVDEENRLKGHFDIFDYKDNKSSPKYIKDHMKEVTYMYSDMSVKDAVYFLNDLGYRNIPVVKRDKTLVGLVTRASVVEEIYNNLWQDYEPEDESKLDYTVID